MEPQLDRQSVVRVTHLSGLTTDLASSWSRSRADDEIVVEEPLEVRVENARQEKQFSSITMRTPGHDSELVRGLLLTEGVIRTAADIFEADHCGPSVGRFQNTYRVRLREGLDVPESQMERRSYRNSSCGVCGLSGSDAVESLLPPPPEPRRRSAISPEFIRSAPEQLEGQQKFFSRTGSIHACGLVALDQSWSVVREDVGRHNALDKLIGWAIEQPERLAAMHDVVLVLSGRVGFELVQKAAWIGVRGLIAIGAPSTLSIEMAKRQGMFLAGFVREGRFNIYAGEEQLEVQ